MRSPLAKKSSYSYFLVAQMYSTLAGFSSCSWVFNCFNYCACLAGQAKFNSHLGEAWIFLKQHNPKLIIILTSPPTPGSVLKVKGSLNLRTPSPFGFGLVMEKRQTSRLLLVISLYMTTEEKPKIN